MSEFRGYVPPEAETQPQNRADEIIEDLRKNPTKKGSVDQYLWLDEITRLQALLNATADPEAQKELEGQLALAKRAEKEAESKAVYGKVRYVRTYGLEGEELTDALEKQEKESLEAMELSQDTIGNTNRPINRLLLNTADSQEVKRNPFLKGELQSEIQAKVAEINSAIQIKNKTVLDSGMRGLSEIINKNRANYDREKNMLFIIVESFDKILKKIEKIQNPENIPWEKIGQLFAK